MSEPILDLIHDASDAVRRVSAAASEVAAGRMHIDDARVEAQSIVERLRAMAVALYGAEAGEPLAYTRAPEAPPGASVQFQGTLSGISRAAEGNGATLEVWPDNAARFTVPIPYNGWREGVHLGRRFIRAVSLGDRVRVTVGNVLCIRPHDPSGGLQPIMEEDSIKIDAWQNAVAGKLA